VQTTPSNRQITTGAGPASTGRRVLIAGAGVIGRALAQRLAGHMQLILVDLDTTRLARAQEALPAMAEVGGAVARQHLYIHGDPTSRLVLERAGAATVDGLVAACDSDDANLEICAIARERFDVPYIVSCLHEETQQPRFAELGIEVIPTGATVAAALSNRLDATRRIASDMGLGQGELVETTVGEGSWVAGQSVQALHANGWLIAAIYRAGSLIVPDGQTVLKTGDRILLVGEPQKLASVADMFHYSHAPFPIPYGRTIAVALPRGYTPEEQQLADHEGRTLAYACHVGKPATLVQQSRGRGAHWILQTETSSNRTASHFPADWGCIIVPAGRASPLAARGWRNTNAEGLLRAFKVPILFARDHEAFTRIVALLHSEATESANVNLSRPLDVALSLAQVLSLDQARPLQVVAVTVTPPDYVGGEDSLQQQQKMSQAMNMVAKTRRQSFERMHVNGNPIQETLRLLRKRDLLVVRAARPGGLTPLRPMVGRYLAQYAPCPVLLVPDDIWARRSGEVQR
jgi:Trk K+ transport system NAD-binding subunit/nucleotide-binding universal stress UspA family protein